jgi:hypothetical protein
MFCRSFKTGMDLTSGRGRCNFQGFRGNLAKFEGFGGNLAKFEGFGGNLAKFEGFGGNLTSISRLCAYTYVVKS